MTDELSHTLVTRQATLSDVEGIYTLNCNLDIKEREKLSNLTRDYIKSNISSYSIIIDTKISQSFVVACMFGKIYHTEFERQTLIDDLNSYTNSDKHKMKEDGVYDLHIDWLCWIKTLIIHKEYRSPKYPSFHKIFADRFRTMFLNNNPPTQKMVFGFNFIYDNSSGYVKAINLHLGEVMKPFGRTITSIDIINNKVYMKLLNHQYQVNSEFVTFNLSLPMKAKL